MTFNTVRYLILLLDSHKSKPDASRPSPTALLRIVFALPADFSATHTVARTDLPSSSFHPRILRTAFVSTSKNDCHFSDRTFNHNHFIPTLPPLPPFPPPLASHCLS